MRAMRGVYPFWFWNGPMERPEIARQIDLMAEQGIKGFFVHPRQGLAVPYLSERFMDLVEFAIGRARERGLSAQLYDEYPYPSGIAGGEVAWENPAWLATRLEQGSVAIESRGEPIEAEIGAGKLLSAWVYPEDEAGRPILPKGFDCAAEAGITLGRLSYNRAGLTSYNQKRFFASEPRVVVSLTLPAGAWRLFYARQVLVNDHKYWGNFVDPLNRDAVRAFIRSTHERYAARFRGEFGSTVGAIYTDEIEGTWSPLVVEAFQRDHGYDCRPLLHALQIPEHPDHLRLARDLGDTVAREFAESFEIPIRDWCAEHGLAWCGEKPSRTVSQLALMDIPGCEPGHTKAGRLPDVFGAAIRGNARAVYSAALVYGKGSTLCECFHSLGWGGTLLDERLIAEALLLAGITSLVPHGYFYSTHGLRKHDAPPTFFFQMPYWRFTKRLTARVDWLLAAFSGTEIDYRLVILEPSEGMPTDGQRSVWRETLDALLAAKVDFLIADGAMLDRIGAPRPAPVLLVPPVRQWGEKALESIERKRREGWTVFRFLAPGEAASFAARVAPSPLTGAVRGAKADRVWTVTRSGPSGAKSYFALNNSDAEAWIDFGAARVGEIPEGEASPQRLLRGPRRLGPFESALFRDIPERTHLPKDEGAEAPVFTLDLSAPLSIKTLDANALRLGIWELELSDPETGQTLFEHPAAEAIPLENVLGGQPRAIPVRFEFGFGTAPVPVPDDLRATYRVSFAVAEGSGPIELVMEPDSILGCPDAAFRLNGQPFGAEDFGESARHIRGSLGVALDEGRGLRKGLNELELTLRRVRPSGGLVNPLYLFGYFAAFRRDGIWELGKAREMGFFEDYEGNGLPFYSGRVEYATDRAFADVPRGETARFALQPSRPFREAAEIEIAGYEPITLPWAPYEWIGRKKDGVGGAAAAESSGAALIRVYTTLSRAFEGSYFDEETHRYVEVP